MRILILTNALYLTACASPDLVIPTALTNPVVVECPEGYTSGALGACLIGLREGLNLANDRLARIAVLTQSQSK